MIIGLLHLTYYFYCIAKEKEGYGGTEGMGACFGMVGEVRDPILDLF